MLASSLFVSNTTSAYRSAREKSASTKNRATRAHAFTNKSLPIQMHFDNNLIIVYRSCIYTTLQRRERVSFDSFGNFHFLIIYFFMADLRKKLFFACFQLVKSTCMVLQIMKHHGTKSQIDRGKSIDICLFYLIP